MAIAVKHAFTSPKSDGTDSTLVKPSNWNAAHVITMAANHLIGLNVGADGNATEIALTTNFDLTTAILDLSKAVVFPGSGAVQVPQGTTAQRPSAPTDGMLRYNTTLDAFEKFEGGEWVPTSTAPGDQTISGNLTVTGEGIFSGTGVVQMPVGNTGQRPVSSPAPSQGMIRFNSDTHRFEGYNGSSWVSISFSTDAASVPKRHTVLAGPMDANGNAAFMQASSASLTISTTGITSGTPLTYTVANGWGPSGRVDLVVQLVANLSWTASPSATTYHGLSYNASSGVTTPISTTLKWITQFGGTLSIAAGQYTYDINRGQMYLGDGANANPVNVIFVAESLAGASSVTSTICYAYQRRYYFANNTGSLPALGANISKNCNLGVNTGIRSELSVIIRTATGTFKVGDVIRNIGCVANVAGNAYGPMATYCDGYTVRFGDANTLNWLVYSVSGSYASVGSASADYVLEAWTDW